MGPSRMWSYGIWIYIYLCNQCRFSVFDSSLMLIRVSDCCLTPKEQLSSYMMAKTCCIQWNDNDDVCFVLDQQVANTNFIVWFNLIAAGIHNLPHSRWVCYPLHHRCGWYFYAENYQHLSTLTLIFYSVNHSSLY